MFVFGFTLKPYWLRYLQMRVLTTEKPLSSSYDGFFQFHLVLCSDCLQVFNQCWKLALSPLYRLLAMIDSLTILLVVNGIQGSIPARDLTFGRTWYHLLWTCKTMRETVALYHLSLVSAVINDNSNFASTKPALKWLSVLMSDIETLLLYFEVYAQAAKFVLDILTYMNCTPQVYSMGKL